MNSRRFTQSPDRRRRAGPSGSRGRAPYRCVTLLASATAAWPLAAGATGAGSDLSSWVSWSGSHDAPTIIAFLDELRGRGFVEAQNFTIVRGRFQVRNEQSADLAPAAGQGRTRRDHQRRRCHHARPPEGDLDNSDSGRTKDRGFGEAAGALPFNQDIYEAQPCRSGPDLKNRWSCPRAA